MFLEHELLTNAIANAISAQASRILEEAEGSMESIAIDILNETKDVICNKELEDDFDVVEGIVCIFESYNIEAGGRHGFR